MKRTISCYVFFLFMFCILFNWIDGRAHHLLISQILDDIATNLVYMVVLYLLILLTKENSK